VDRTYVLARYYYWEYFLKDCLAPVWLVCGWLLFSYLHERSFLLLSVLGVAELAWWFYERPARLLETSKESVTLRVGFRRVVFPKSALREVRQLWLEGTTLWGPFRTRVGLVDPRTGRRRRVTLIAARADDIETLRWDAEHNRSQPLPVSDNLLAADRVQSQG
jgi:hypothetical protein